MVNSAYVLAIVLGLASIANKDNVLIRCVLGFLSVFVVTAAMLIAVFG